MKHESGEEVIGPEKKNTTTPLHPASKTITNDLNHRGSLLIPASMYYHVQLQYRIESRILMNLNGVFVTSDGYPD